jgi:hypothetical protein
MTTKKAEANGAVPIEERIVLSPEQAAMGQQLFAASQQINEKLQIWMAGVGINGNIVGGDFGDDPHLVISKPDPANVN